MEEKYTLTEAHLTFAKQLHGQVWRLLEKSNRNRDEDERMLHASHASLYHWLQVGSGLNHQRGVWLIARVHAFLGNGEQALYYASRCMELTEEYADLMEDFDWAFAWEGLARASAVDGRAAEAQKALDRAFELGEALADEEDRRIFFLELDDGEWYGVR